MSKSARKKGLGKGLAALIGDQAAAFEADAAAASTGNAAAGTVRPGDVSGGAAVGRTLLPLAYLEANPDQPRRNFQPDAIEELASSIKDRGLLQPILVREIGKDRYQIVAGERRWRACQKIGLHDVPVVVRDLDDNDVLQIAIVENIQREDLSPIEEGRAYRRLKEEFGHADEAIANAVSKSRSHVTNLMRLLQLPDLVQAMVDKGQISMGHARALIGAVDGIDLAHRVIREGLSVRQTEALVGQVKGKRGREPRPGGQTSVKDADTLALEKDLAAATGAKVAIEHNSDQTGKLVLTYTTLDQLDDLCAKLGVCGLE